VAVVAVVALEVKERKLLWPDTLEAQQVMLVRLELVLSLVLLGK
jgi:hypothetical protein